MAKPDRNSYNFDNLEGFGNNVILTRADNGRPTLVNLFRMITADEVDGGTEIVIDSPKAIAGAGAGDGTNYGGQKIEFKAIDCTKKIKVKETLQEIVAKQAKAMQLAR